MRSDHSGVFEGMVRIREESRSQLLSKNMMGILNSVLQVILSQASAWAFVHIFTTAFGLTVSEVPFFFITLIISVIMLFLVRGQKAGIIMLAGLLAVGALLLFLKRHRIIAECAGLYVSVVRSFTAYYGYVSEVGLDIETSYNVTYVMSCFAFLPVWQVSYSYGKHTYPSLLTIFLLLPLFLCVAGGQSPSLLSVAVMALCILAVYFTCMTESINTDHEMSERVRKRIRFILIALAVLLTAAFISIAAFVIFPQLKNFFHNASDVYTSHFFRDLLADIPGNPLDISKTGLSEGELQRAGSVVQTGESAFTMTYEKDNPRVTYFRNFTGDTYTGDRWAAAETELPGSLFPESITYPSVYSPNVSVESATYRNPLLYYQASFLSTIYRTIDRENTLTITDRSGGGNYFYLPYGVTGKISAGERTASFRIYSDLYGLGTAPEVTYPVYTPGSLVDVLEMTEGDAFFEGLSQPDGDAIVRYLEPEALSALLKDYGTDLTPDEILDSGYSEYVVKTGDGKKLHYRLKEACLTAYENYVHLHDLQTPDSERLQAVAAELANQYGIDVNACEYVKAVLAVQNYLSAQCTFNEHPGAIGSNVDFTETFLFEKREGYCVHFATAGTVLLRYLGVPARYAEGFLVQPCTAGEQVSVTDYDAHAWTEVFIPGYGWYPVEMTPSEAPDEPQSSETESEPEPAEPETSEEENMPSSEPETEPETTEVADDNEEDSERTKARTNLWPILRWFLLAAVLLGGIGTLLYLLHRIRPMEKLKGADSRETYLNIYRECQRHAAFRRKHFVVDDSPEELVLRFPGMDPGVLEEVQRYAKEAYYSENEIPDEAVEMLYGLYQDRSFEAKDIKKADKEINGSAE